MKARERSVRRKRDARRDQAARGGAAGTDREPERPAVGALGEPAPSRRRPHLMLRDGAPPSSGARRGDDAGRAEDRGPRDGARGARDASFVPIARPARLFALDSAELAKADESYDALRSAASAMAVRTASISALRRMATSPSCRSPSIAPASRLSIPRACSSICHVAPLRRACGVEGHAGRAMRSKFGEMENAEVKLSIAGVERACIAFRRAVADEACAYSAGIAHRRVTREQCRGWHASSIVWRSPAVNEDKVLRASFARGEVREGHRKPPARGFCAASVPAAARPASTGRCASSQGRRHAAAYT